jgi:hypothetical protein
MTTLPRDPNEKAPQARAGKADLSVVGTAGLGRRPKVRPHGPAGWYPAVPLVTPPAVSARRAYTLRPGRAGAGRSPQGHRARDAGGGAQRRSGSQAGTPGHSIYSSAMSSRPNRHVDLKRVGCLRIDGERVLGRERDWQSRGGFLMKLTAAHEASRVVGGLQRGVLSG